MGYANYADVEALKGIFDPKSLFFSRHFAFYVIP
jgi:hypothetical protein